MKSRVETALRKYSQGYNCAQAIACTYADLLGVDEETAYHFAEAFGSGMGGLQETCGTVTGLFMLAGMKQNSTLGDKSKRPDTYKTVREIARSFKELNATILCRNLKGSNGTQPLRSCTGCIEDAARLAETLLFKEEQE